MPKPDLLNLAKSPNPIYQNLDWKPWANFGNHAKPKSDIADKTNFDESKPIQTKATTKNLEAHFENHAKPKNDFATGMNFYQTKLLQTETLTEKHKLI